MVDPEEGNWFPEFATKPYLPGHTVLYNKAATTAVSATSDLGGYPQVASMANGPQKWDQIRNTLALQTVILGKLDAAQIVAAIGENPEPNRQYDKLANSFRNQFCSLEKDGDKYDAILEEWTMHDALVKIHNLSVDISLALAHGDDEAQVLQAQLVTYQTGICGKLDNYISNIQSRSDFPKPKAFQQKQGDGLTYAQYVAWERQRLQVLKDQFSKSPASLLSDPDPAAAEALEKQPHYLRKSKKDRLQVWKQPEFFESMVVLFLNIAIGPMEIADSVRSPLYHEYLSNQIANFCDAAIELVVGPQELIERVEYDGSDQEQAVWAAMRKITEKMPRANVSCQANTSLFPVELQLTPKYYKAFKARHWDFHEQWNRACEKNGHPEKKVTGIEVLKVSPSVRGKNRIREKNKAMRQALMAKSLGASGPAVAEEDEDEDVFGIGT